MKMVVLSVCEKKFRIFWGHPHCKKVHFGAYYVYKDARESKDAFFLFLINIDFRRL